ncbi:hypothetical protein ASG01_01765 [Chryseobacterium sp. Leaf180]|uniref:hypothetical protein n=1 Tax=Chryseobacterium sp. Leaf180 TaxID=1736289 RepID=UPI0006FEE23A|nr:hypothetical protein [Chryseobacterium sp. Leaf180]KQR94632.1 hypothetical protein ASG01_01765 [Chryseobacterium sp. Leaf180]
MNEDDNNVTFQESFVINQSSVSEDQIISFKEEKSFILNSLQRLKISTVCEIRRKIIDSFITEYISNIPYSSTANIFNENLRSTEMHFENAKNSYIKVIKEQEYLNKIIATLNF